MQPFDCPNSNTATMEMRKILTRILNSVKRLGHRITYGIPKNMSRKEFIQ